MRDKEVPVTFEPSGRSVYVLEGTPLVEAAAEAGVVVDQPCGGEGICGKCRVRILSGAADPTGSDRSAFSAEELAAGFRLACQTRIVGPTTIREAEDALGAEHQILAASAADAAPWADSDDPPVRKVYCELPPPTRADDLSDLMRLERAVGPFEPDLDVLRALPGTLRENAFRGTAVLADHRLIGFEAGDTRTAGYSVAVDVGTTTLAAALVDLAGQREVAVASSLNPQTRFGDDVLSRIAYAGRNEGLQTLHDAVIGVVDAMIGDLCWQAGVARENVYEVAVSGNTTMEHLFCRLDPHALGEVPFTPAIGRGLLLPAAELGLHIHPRGRVYVLPVINGFVGGDTVAGILATRMTDTAGPTLLVDIGTNGEIVLWAGGRLSAASTAAGPAFEGARISQGMRGSTGAIEKVIVDGRLRVNVIGNVPPTGICGSGLIDAAAELLRHGLLTPQGRLVPPGELPSGVPEDLARRIVSEPCAAPSGSCSAAGKIAFELARADETAHGKPILLTQRDLRELQLASGAIRAGIKILLRRSGLRPEDLDSVLVAGGFGNFIRRSNAQRIGLLPEGIERKRIRYQGNTSLAGARWTVLSQAAREKAEKLGRLAEHVDLSTDADFSMTFAEAMIFPES